MAFVRKHVMKTYLKGVWKGHIGHSGYVPPFTSLSLTHHQYMYVKQHAVISQSC